MGSKAKNLFTCWIPFCDIDIEMGSLAVLPGSHRNETFRQIRETYGQGKVKQDGTTSGWLKGISIITAILKRTETPTEVNELFDDPDVQKDLKWETCNFKAGDLVLLSIDTLHCTLANETGKLRMSCDARFHPTNEDAGFKIAKRLEEVLDKEVCDIKNT
jgi:ectoine hydroxylase-related dioxygenase (phytanoyl-CoA dioxygenase family)